MFRHKYKVCGRCGAELRIDLSYYRNNYNPDKLDRYCKWCRNEYNADWNKENPERRYLHQWRYRNRQEKAKHQTYFSSSVYRGRKLPVIREILVIYKCFPIQSDRYSLRMLTI